MYQCHTSYLVIQKYIDLMSGDYIPKYTVDCHKRKYPLFNTAFDRRYTNKGNNTKAYIQLILL